MQYKIDNYEIFKRNALSRVAKNYKDPHTTDACGPREWLPYLDCNDQMNDLDIVERFVRLYNCVFKRSRINEAYLKEIQENDKYYSDNVINQAKREYATHKHMENA